MYFFYFIKRYLSLIILSVFIFGALGTFYGLKNNNISAKTTLFLTIANKDLAKPDQAETAANFFGETLIGWFRNPVFIHSIKKNITDPSISISAQKQERQNIIVDIVSQDKESSKKASKITFTKLKEELERYNNQTESNFVILNQGSVTKNSSAQNLIFPLLGIVFGFFLALVLFSFKEFVRNEVSSLDEIEEIFGKKSLDFFNKNLEKNDFTPLSVFIQKSNSIVILAGVNFNTQILAVALAHKHSYFGEKLTLVDGDLNQRSLQKILGISNRIKNLKGHTDALINEDNVVETSLIIQNTLHDNLKFLPAGKGEKFLTKVFHNVSSEMKTLIHTELPQNFEILRLQEATLVLVIKLGKTKKKDLQRIKQVWNKELQFVVVE